MSSKVVPEQVEEAFNRASDAVSKAAVKVQDTVRNGGRTGREEGKEWSEWNEENMEGNKGGLLHKRDKYGTRERGRRQVGQ